MEKNQLSELVNAGVELTVIVPNNVGVEAHICSVDDVLMYLKRPTALYAAHFGVSESDYQRCLAEDYAVKCSGITTKGYPCQAIVKNGFNVDPKTWASMNGEYCQIHSDADF